MNLASAATTLSSSGTTRSQKHAMAAEIKYSAIATENIAFRETDDHVQLWLQTEPCRGQVSM